VTGRHDVPGGGPEVLASGLGAVLNSTRASQSFARVFLVSQKCAGLGRPGARMRANLQRRVFSFAKMRRRNEAGATVEQRRSAVVP
jgi:hypothetical protein